MERFRSYQSARPSLSLLSRALGATRPVMHLSIKSPTIPLLGWRAWKILITCWTWMTFFGHSFQLVVNIAHAPRLLTLTMTWQFSMACMEP